MAQAPPQQKYSVLPVVLLALSALLAGAGFGIYAPTIVVHAIELGAPEAIATAMVMALPSILMLIILLPVAIVADKTGRRKEIVSIGLLLGTIFNALLAMARSWIELAVYRTVSGVVFAFTSLYMAMAIFVTPERLKRYSSRYSRRFYDARYGCFTAFRRSYTWSCWRVFRVIPCSSCTLIDSITSTTTCESSQSSASSYESI
jgi:hypothetical protein